MLSSRGQDVVKPQDGGGESLSLLFDRSVPQRAVVSEETISYRRKDFCPRGLGRNTRSWLRSEATPVIYAERTRPAQI